MSENRKLLVKIQHKGFETSEYCDMAERSYEETIELIKSFPWKDERYNTSVIPTGPSILIENDDGDYLKFAHYYDPKFCLYLYTYNNKFYRKVLVKPEDGFNTIADFYADNTAVDDFVKLNALFQKRHFLTNDFIYKMTFGRIMSFLIFPAFLAVVFGTCFIVMLFSSPVILSALLCILLALVFLSGINLSMLVNHYLFNRDIIIQISKGADSFMFGKQGEMKTYSKKDIDKIVEFNARNLNSKGPPWNEYEIITVVLKDGEILKFTNLLMSGTTFLGKTKDVPLERKNKYFPYVRR